MRAFTSYTLRSLPLAACLFLAALVLTAVPALAVKEYAPGTPASFGESGSGPGQLKDPTSVAVNSSTELGNEQAGDVYVLDKGNSRVEYFNSAGTKLEGEFNGAATPTKSFAEPEGIAIDNSGKTVIEDPSVGDVYVPDIGHDVIDRFSATGEYKGQLIGTCENAGESAVEPGACPASTSKKVVPFNGVRGVAVDPEGNVWVYELESEGLGKLDKLSNAGVFLETFNTGKSVNPGLAVDELGQLYIITEAPVVRRITPPEPGGVTIDEASGVSGVATDEATGDVYVDHGNVVRRYGPSGEPFLEEFGSGQIAGGTGLAVNQNNASVYLADTGTSRVDIFNYLTFPTVRSPAASEVSNTVETLNGTVEPEGETVKACTFEYGLVKAEPGHYEHSIPCEQEASSITGTSKTVSRKIEGLTPGATYHFRLDASNKNGTGNSTDATFTLFPGVGGESFSDVGSSSATLHATVDPGGVPTAYFFEYGPGTEYGSRTPSETAGASTEGVGVEARIEGLSQDSTYHFRLVATSADGAIRGPDSVFSTLPAAVAGLPDGRGYELVSPLENGYAEVVSGIRAAADGGAVAYQGQAPETGGGNGNNAGPNETGLNAGGDNQYLAQRAGTGWTATDIDPKGAYTVSYEAFSSSLSTGILTSEEPLVSGAPTGKGTHRGPTGLYAREESGAYRLLGENAGYAGSTPDGKQILVSQKGKLEEVEPETGKSSPINVLPEGGLAANAVFGAAPAQEGDLSNVISADGSRVIWTETNAEGHPARLFEDEGVGSGAQKTVQLDALEPGCVPCTIGGEGKFWTASSDGSRVFFTDEKQLTTHSSATLGQPDLYEYDLDTNTLTDLTPATTNPGEHANVVGVLGTSSDGSYVYFAAGGSLAGSGATPQECSPAIAGQHEHVSEAIKCDVYVLHDGEAPRLVAAITNFDGEGGNANFLHGGDWVRVVGSRSSFVSGDGRVLVFKSIEDLTGFDSLEDQEVYAYDYGVGLTCVSCNSSGVPTFHGESYEVDAELPNSGSALFALRDLSTNGNRVFFETAEALVPQDGNNTQDIYEWEQPGEGTCTVGGPAYTSRDNGCIYLISGGTSAHKAQFVDASENGDDVFFISDSELVPADHGEYTQLWDARVGAIEPLAGTACTGTGCQGVPSAPPIFATPSSVTFNGTGNFPAPKPAVVKKKTAAQLKAEKLSKALKACRAKRGKKRSGCEASARRRYGAKPAKGKKRR
jgi:hypothetical protein